jgi:hypothetical protein
MLPERRHRLAGNDQLSVFGPILDPSTRQPRHTSEGTGTKGCIFHVFVEPQFMILRYLVD